jgi:hypothetical protein
MARAFFRIVLVDSFTKMEDSFVFSSAGLARVEWAGLGWAGWLPGWLAG